MKKAILFKLLFTGLLFSSCSVDGFFGNDDMEECGHVPSNFKVKGLTSLNLRFTNEGSNPWEITQEDSILNWNNYFIRFRFETEYFDLESSSNARIALSCFLPGNSGDTVGVDTIYFISVSDYNEKYKSNDTINDIILTNDWTREPDDFYEFDSVKTFIQMTSTGIRDPFFEIKLSEAPGSSGSFSFKTTCILNDGSEFSNTSEAVTLK